MYVILNGKFVEEKKAVIPVVDHGFLYGDAVYETMRTKDGELWMFNEHIRRLNASAKAIGIGIRFRELQIREQIYELIKKNKLREARVRVTLSRGSNGFNFGSAKSPTLLIQASKIKFPPRHLYEHGVSVVTFDIQRPMPKVKSTSMLSTVMAYKYAQKKRAYEALLVDDRGRITEGSISNVFFIRKGKIFTPKKNLLEGTVRNFIIKKAKVKQTTIKKRDLPKMDEAFITSTIKGILPVTRINGRKVGDGEVGSVTKALMDTLF